MKKEEPIDHITMNNKEIIVTFDVGGQIHRVSKDILLQFPNTMLYMSVSDLDTCNQDNPIFIERNGHRFQYVLDYIRNDSNSLRLPSTIDRESFFEDMEYYGFRCDHDIYFPKDIKYLDGIEYHHVKWDVSYASRGLVFECKNHVVKRNSSEFGLEWQSVIGTVGFNEGIHFWSLEIINGIDIMIGCSNGMIPTSSYFPGIDSKDTYTGFSYSSKTGHTHVKGNHFGFGPSFGEGDVIGTLLNMNRKTVTFYMNGIRLRTAATIATLNENTYYPCVSFSTSDQEIRSVGYNKIFTDK